MENQTSEETQEVVTEEPTEVETPEETTEQTSEETVENETPETPTVDYENKFKESQKEALRLKKQLDELKKPKESNPSSGKIDVDEILEIQSATKGLSNDEVAELKLRAQATGKSLSEAREDENFGMWRQAYKAKVEKQKALNPSTTQSESNKPKTLEDRLLAAKTHEEKGKILSEAGLNPMNLGSNLDLVEEF